MAGVAQLVRAPDCGPGGREFDSRRPPHLFFTTHWGVAKWLRHRILIPAFVGSNPATPASFWQQILVGPLAQSVEHLIFNQGVRSSSLRWTTTKKTISFEMVFFVYVVIGAEKNSAYYPEFARTSKAIKALPFLFVRCE